MTQLSPEDVTSATLATYLADAWDEGYSACCQENSPDGHHLSHRVSNPWRLQAGILDRQRTLKHGWRLESTGEEFPTEEALLAHVFQRGSDRVRYHEFWRDQPPASS